MQPSFLLHMCCIASENMPVSLLFHTVSTACFRLAAGSGLRHLRWKVKVWRSWAWVEATVRAWLRRRKLSFVYNHEKPQCKWTLCVRPLPCSGGKAAWFIYCSAERLQSSISVASVMSRLWPLTEGNRALRGKEAVLCEVRCSANNYWLWSRYSNAGVWPFYMPQVFSHQRCGCLHGFLYMLLQSMITFHPLTVLQMQHTTTSDSTQLQLMQKDSTILDFFV